MPKISCKIVEPLTKNCFFAPPPPVSMLIYEKVHFSTESSRFSTHATVFNTDMGGRGAQGDKNGVFKNSSTILQLCIRVMISYENC